MSALMSLCVRCLGVCVFGGKSRAPVFHIVRGVLGPIVTMRYKGVGVKNLKIWVTSFLTAPLAF